MRLKIEFTYNGEHNIFDSQTVQCNLPRMRTDVPTLMPILQGATFQVSQTAARNSIFQNETVEPTLYEASFLLPNTFIVTFPNKLLSAASDSNSAQLNREIIKNTPEGWRLTNTFTTQTSNGEKVKVQVDLKVLRVIDDMSQGPDRVLMPLIIKKKEDKSGRIPVASHVLTTANCNINDVFLTYLPAVRTISPTAMAVGFVENNDANYLIIANSKDDYLRIRAGQLIEIGLITWYIAKDVPTLLNTIFSHIPLKKVDTMPSIPVFFRYDHGTLEEIPNDISQDNAPRPEF